MTDKTLEELLEMHEKTIALKMHPVGCYYMSDKPTNPHELFGGTWEPIQDTFLWCAGPKHAAGTTGGEETHTLTVEESPEHTHDISSTTITGSFAVWWSTVNTLSGCFWGDCVTHNPSRNGVADNSVDYYDLVNFKNTHLHSIGNTGGN